MVVYAFTPDGSRALSASGDGTLRVWDVATGKELAKLTGDLTVALQGISQRSPAPQVLVLCPPSPAALARPELASRLQQLESSLASALAGSGSIFLITSGEIEDAKTIIGLMLAAPRVGSPLLQIEYPAV